jgi:hypothetical protein
MPFAIPMEVGHEHRARRSLTPRGS